MTSWCRVTLESIAESVDYGVTASAVSTEIGPKFLRITDIQDEKVDWGAVPWCNCDDKSKQSSRLKRGDIVFARTGATTGKSYLIGDCPEDAVFASYLIRLRLNASSDPAFVAHFFRTADYWSQITNHARGAAQPGVNATTLKSLKIPLPPLPEQRRIAAILDKADALRTQRREALAQLDRLAQAIFVEMFGDPVTNPKGWPNYSLRELASRIQIGPFGSQLHEEDYVEDGIPLVNPTHIQQGRIKPDWTLTIPCRKHAQLEQYHLAKGDLILGRRGEMGRCAVVSKVEQGWLCGTGSLFVRPNPSSLSPEYLQAVLSSPPMRRHLENVSQGVTMANLNKDIVGALPIALPPRKLQELYFSRISSVAVLMDQHRRSAETQQELFASLQHRAFRGELNGPDVSQESPNVTTLA